MIVGVDRWRWRYLWNGFRIYTKWGHLDAPYERDMWTQPTDGASRRKANIFISCMSFPPRRVGPPNEAGHRQSAVRGDARAAVVVVCVKRARPTSSLACSLEIIPTPRATDRGATCFTQITGQERALCVMGPSNHCPLRPEQTDSNPPSRRLATWGARGLGKVF